MTQTIPFKNIAGFGVDVDGIFVHLQSCRNNRNHFVFSNHQKNGNWFLKISSKGGKKYARSCKVKKQERIFHFFEAIKNSSTIYCIIPDPSLEPSRIPLSHVSLGLGRAPHRKRMMQTLTERSAERGQENRGLVGIIGGSNDGSGIIYQL